MECFPEAPSSIFHPASYNIEMSILILFSSCHPHIYLAEIENSRCVFDASQVTPPLTPTFLHVVLICALLRYFVNPLVPLIYFARAGAFISRMYLGSAFVNFLVAREEAILFTAVTAAPFQDHFLFSTKLFTLSSINAPPILSTTPTTAPAPGIALRAPEKPAATIEPTLMLFVNAFVKLSPLHRLSAT